MAAGDQRNCIAYSRTTVDVVRGHRLETAGANMAAIDGGVSYSR